jgi:hypothetical protein
MRDRSDWYLEDDPLDSDFDGPERAPHVAEGVPGKVSRTTAVARQLHRMSLAGAGPASPAAPAGAALEHARAHGSPSALPHRDTMEGAFGRSFADVEAISGPGAERAAGMVDAVAFAVGNTVVLPSSPSPALVAHELTHVVQQGAARVAPTADLEVTDPSGAAEREADAVAGAVARGAPAPAIGAGGGQVARLARTPAGDATAAEEAEEPGVDWKAVARRATSDEESKLFRYTVEALKKKDDASLESATRATLIAEGRKRWRAAVGSDMEYLLQLAQELGDDMAETKIGYIRDEAYFDDDVDGDALRADYFRRVVALLNADGSDYLETTKLYDPNGSAFTRVLGSAHERFCRKGRILDFSKLPEGHDLLYRTGSLPAFFGGNLKPSERDGCKREFEELIRPEHRGSDVDVDRLAFNYWIYKLAKDPAVCESAGDLLDRRTNLGGGNGTTWWSYKGVELAGIEPADLGSAGLPKCLDLFALDPEWYPHGAVYISVDGPALNDAMTPRQKLRKPTALDGVLSHLWTPAAVPETTWGITGGGAPEAVAPFLPSRFVTDIQIMPVFGPSLERIQQVLTDYGTADAADLADGEIRTLILEINPSFELLLPSGASARVTIPAPPILHPGIRFSQIDLNLGSDGGGVTGTATLDVRASGAFSAEAAQLDIRPSESGGARVDNDIPEVQSPLSQLLGRIESEARITDTGVEAEMSITPGASGIPGFDLEEATLEARYSEGQVSAEGRVGIAHNSGKMSGDVGATWDGGQWVIRGEAQVQDLVDGLDPFSVTLERQGEQTSIRAGEVAFHRQIGAIDLRGKATDLQYDVATSAFAGSLDVDADLGMFGEANAAARMANNEIEEARFSLASKELSYPAGDANPLVRGMVNGEVVYNEGAFSGNVNGHASLRLPGVVGGEAQDAAGLEVDVAVGEDGSYTGEIRAGSPVQIGEYLRIDEASLTLGDDGAVTGRVTANLLNVPFLERGQVTWAIADGAITIESVDAQLSGSLGMFGADRLHLDVQLVEGGISGTLSVTEGASGIPGLNLDESSITFSYINGQITANGTLGLAHESGMMSGSLTVGWADGWSLDGRGRLEEGIVPGLSAVDLRIEQSEDRVRIFAEEGISYDKTFGAITIAGTGTLLEFDTETGGFSGTLDLTADLGMFGAATASGTIANNALAAAEFTYESPQLRYPPGSESPILSSDEVTATLSYAEGAFSGSLSAVANLRLPDVLGGLAEEAAGIAVNVQIGDDGSYSGTVSTTGPVTLGTFLRIDALEATVASEGGLSGTFTMNVVNMPMLKRGEVTCAFNDEGISIESVDAELSGNLEALGAERVEVSLRLTESGIGGAVGGTAGPSGIPGFSLADSSIEFMYTEGTLTAAGHFGFSHDSGKIAGELDIEWDGDDWKYSGEGTVDDLIAGLEPFTISLAHGPEGTTVGVDRVAYERTFGAITLSGHTENLTYDVDKRSFGGNVAVAADLGMFGSASAAATIVDNEVDVGEITYDSPELKYPPGSDSPLISGTVGGTVQYSRGAFSGTLRSQATMNLPGLLSSEDSDGLGVDVNVRIGADGTYSGNLRTTQPVQIGDYFRIQSLQGELTEDGEVSSEFTVDIVNLSFLNEGSVTCAIDKDGFRVLAVSAEVPFGTENETRAWGTISAGYSEEDGFLINGKANVKIKDGMVANGDISYSTKTNMVSATLGVDEITIINYQRQHELFDLRKRIPVFSAAGLAGLYIDLGFTLLFDYNMLLKLNPSITLENLDLDDFSFDRAGAEIGLDGELSAALIGVPSIGAGAFALHPMILRGGGGLALEIAGRAAITPDATLSAGFTPDGEVTGQAKVAMPLTFGITAAIRPYAEVALLDGAIEKTWEGDNLAEFELLPKQELFTFTLDLGGDLTEQEAPELPDSPQEPPQPEGDVVLEQEESAPQTTPVEADANAAAESSEPEAASDEGGFSLTSLIDGLLGLPQLSSIRAIADAAAETWEKIKNFIGGIGKFFSKWFDKIGGAITDILRGIGEHGLFGYLKIALKGFLGDNLFHIIEPFLDELCAGEARLMRLLDREPPTASNFLSWTIDFLVDFLGVAFDSLPGLVRSVGVVKDRLVTQGGRFINHLIQEGKLGVQRHSYYIWRPWPADDYYFLAASEYKIDVAGFRDSHKERGMLTSPRSAVGHGLWLALEAYPGVNPTYRGWHEKAGTAYNDYWV